MNQKYSNEHMREYFEQYSRAQQLEVEIAKMQRELESVLKRLQWAYEKIQELESK